MMKVESLNPLFLCLMDQLPQVESFLDAWRQVGSRKVGDIEWLVMDIATGKRPNQFYIQFYRAALNKKMLFEALSETNAQLAQAKLSGLNLRRLALEVLALGLIQALIKFNVEVPKEVVTSYKKSLNLSAECLTGETLDVFSN